jgi:transcriptional regulator with XRE-family HTH domain
MQHIAQRIEALRVAKGLSETQLAAESGIARMTLKRRMVTPSTFTFGELERVAQVLDTTPFDLAADIEASA